MDSQSASALPAEQDLADLQLIADSLTALAGFRAATIRIARPDGLHLAVVSGSEEARRALAPIISPERLLEELAHADDWGLFKFVPADRVDDDGPFWASDLVPLDREDAWQPLDLLVAPLRDAAGALRGTLSVDMPTDGRRPGPERRAQLTRYAAQAERAILLAIEREELARQVQLAETAREVIRKASRTIEPERVLAEVGAGLVDVLDLAAAWIHVTQPDGSLLTRVYREDARGPITDRPDLYHLAINGPREMWQRRQVSVVSIDGTSRNAGDDETVIRALVDNLADTGLGSVVCAPLGYGDTWYGALVLGRGPDAPDWSELELDTIRDLGRDLGGVVHTSRTYRRQQETISALQELAGRKSRLIATVAHELRTPLTAIRWNLDGLALSRGEEYDDVLDLIERNRRRTRQIVADLAVLATVTDPAQLPAPEPVLVAPVLREAYDLVRGGHRDTWAGPDIEIEPSEERLAVFLARGELDRIVLNLLGNAVKYSPPGSCVTVATRRVGDEVELTVSDEGIGISAEDQEHLFTEFFRSSNPVALAHPGTGLGLAIVRRIVNARGGSISVDSVPGAGSTFRVRLPLATGRS